MIIPLKCKSFCYALIGHKKVHRINCVSNPCDQSSTWTNLDTLQCCSAELQKEKAHQLMMCWKEIIHYILYVNISLFYIVPALLEMFTECFPLCISKMWFDRVLAICPMLLIYSRLILYFLVPFRNEVSCTDQLQSLKTFTQVFKEIDCS